MKKVNEKTNVLRDFFNVSHWETLVVLISLIITFIIMYFVIKRYKLKFQYRMLIGLAIGIIFGVSISAGSGFPNKEVFDNETKWGSFEWGYQLSQWFGMFKSVFISGLMIMMLPIIFLSLARILSKTTKSSLVGITWKGIVILLVNVAVAFAITFWIGYFLNIGHNFEINPGSKSEKEPMKGLTEILTDYMPNNFFKNMGQVVVIPVLVLGALVGLAIRKLSKRNPKMMTESKKNLERYWKICMSVLTFVIKFMPYVVLTMIGLAIFERPISEFASIGEIIGLGYLCLFISYVWHTFTIWLFGISPTKFIKKSYQPLLSGFLTQSSMATMPLAIKTLKEDMELEKISATPDVIMPLSTTIGLTGCAGVQSGVILTLLLNSVNSPVSMNVGIFFLLGLIVTIFVSLGIAGVPGTSTIVTIGVLSTLGFPAYVDSTIGVISPLNGVFDMGRTAVNVNGGMQACLITSALEGEVPKNLQTKSPLSPVLSKYIKWKKKKRAQREK